MNKSDTEINFFAEQAQTWWSHEGPAALLHQINPIRLRFITQTVQLKAAQVLDVGCGGGILTEAMAKLGAEITGLDLAAPLIEVAREHAGQEGLHINYVCEAVEAFAEQHAAQFDVITCMEMLEHVPDPKSVLKALSKMLKPGGYLFLSTIDRSLMSFFKLIIGAEYILKFLPRGTHHYQQFIRPAELTASLREFGVKPHKLNGMAYNFLSKTFSLSAKPTENYLLCAQK